MRRKEAGRWINQGALARAASLAVLVCAGLCFPAVVSAHAFSSSTSRITVDGRTVRIVFTINLADLHTGPIVDANADGIMSVDEVDASIETIYGAVKANYHVTAPGLPVSAVVDRYQMVDDGVLQFDITYVFDEPVGRLTLTSTLDRITQPDHRHLARVTLGETAHEGVLDVSTPTVTLESTAAAQRGRTARRFVTLGIEHIFTGYDHLAFLVGLVVSATSLAGIVKVVTAFTAAHSLTLGLATFGLVSVPSRVIESLIALSIAYVAIENLLRARVEGRWRITFLFGLVHGFGFSNVLREMQLPRSELAMSIFTFNAGVEIGQVLFVVALFPLMYLLTSSRWKQQLVPACSAAIMCLGVYWFVQRAFLR